MERLSGLQVGQLSAPEDVAERNRLKLSLDACQLRCKPWPFKQRDQGPGCFVLDVRFEQAGITTVSRATKENPLAVNVG